MAITWIILTGEYPPQLGGVADYSHQVGRELAAAGDVVHVFAPPIPAQEVELATAGVTIHRLPDRFGAAGRAMIDRVVRTLPAHRRILVQYVPHAFGYRGMNIGFARWINRTAKREPVDVMFHEVHFPVERGQSIRHRLLGHVTRWMARQVAVHAARRFISTSTWNRALSSLGVTGPNRWTPVPTNLPIISDVRNVRDRIAALRIGHFGTYGSYVADLLEPILIALRSRGDCEFIMMGRGSRNYVDQFLQRHPQFTSQMDAPLIKDDQALIMALGGCDLLIQPYPDGMSTRRTTAMAGLALGVPVVTHVGPSTESIWSESNGVALAESAAASDYLEKIIPLLGDRVSRQELGDRGAALYAERFALEHTISALRTIAVDQQ